MQILQWLFRVPKEQLAETPPTSKRMLTFEENKEENQEELECKKVDVGCSDSVTILLTRTYSSRTCFYSSINLKSLKSLYLKKDWLQSHITKAEEMGMGHEAEHVHGVGSKVLPLCGVSSSAPPATNYSTDASSSVNSKKKRAISRMKELLRWAAAAKTTDKAGNKRWKVLYFGHKGAQKAATFGEMSPCSSKMSFRWDVGSCSTSSSVFSPLSMASSFAGQRSLARQHSDESSINESCLNPKSDEYVRIGNWVTTDSEFVVLEL